MATKKTDSKKSAPKAKAKAPAKKAAAPAPKKERKAPAQPAKPRHPKARVIEGHKTKEALAKSLADVIARDDEDTDALVARLTTASNAQLLRLHDAASKVKSKYGDRSKLIAAISSKQNKAKDKDYVAKLGTYSLPQLLDLADRA